MASTGKTTNYELSQFIGTDKPSWLGDYNGDMLKIDTALGSINATATTAQSGVASAQSAASAAQQTANAAQQKATNNAQDITELKADLVASSGGTTPNPQNTDNNNYWLFSKNSIVMTLKGSTFIPASGITSKVDQGDSSFFPLQSVVGNPFKLTVSTIANNSFFVGPAFVGASDGSIKIMNIFATYDGVNTVFSGSYHTINLSQLNSSQVVISSAIVLAGPSNYPNS